MSAVSTMISTGEYFVCPALASAFFFSSSLSVGSLVSSFCWVSWAGALRPPGRWAVTSGAPTRKASSDETKTRRKAFARCGVAIKRPKLASPPILLSDLLGQPLAVYPNKRILAQEDTSAQPATALLRECGGGRFLRASRQDFWLHAPKSLL